MFYSAVLGNLKPLYSQYVLLQSVIIRHSFDFNKAVSTILLDSHVISTSDIRSQNREANKGGSFLWKSRYALLIYTNRATVAEKFLEYEYNVNQSYRVTPT